MASFQLEIGERHVFSKTVAEADVYMFAGITGDLAPQHVNQAYMETSPYGGRIAHGALIVGYMSTASSLAINGKPMDKFTPVSLGYDRIRFLKPVFLGDTVTVEYVIDTIDDDRQRATSDIQVTNQNGETVAVATHHLKWVANDKG